LFEHKYIYKNAQGNVAMNIREFTRPATAKKLNESLAKKFGARIDIDQFTTEQLQDVRNKIRTKLSQTETNESFDAVQDKAELVMASKDMVDRLTGWMEDTAEMQTESMLELADAIRDEMGSEQSEAFTALVKPALEAMYGVMETTRQTLTQGVGMLTGEADPVDTMGGEDPDMDMDMEPVDDELAPGEVGMPDEVDDGMGSADAAAGGEDLGGREKRESKQHSKKKLK
jgi:hypothetical protein